MDVIERYLGTKPRSNAVDVISLTALLLLVWTTAEPVYLYALDSPVLHTPKYIIGVLTVVPSCLGMIYGAQWSRKREFSTEQCSKIKLYWLTGGSCFLVFNVVLMASISTESIWILVSWIRWSLAVGLGVGLVVGIAQVRVVVSTLTAERESLRAEHAEKQRDLIDQMNGILRHEVLNSAQVITGNASVLMAAEEPIDPDDERIERVHRQGEEITTVIQEVRTLLSTIEDGRELTETNLTNVLRNEIQKVRDQHPEIDVELRCQDDHYIRADELAGRIFANILRNAVEHNETPSLQIVVDIVSVDDAVVVTIEDDGQGIPERKLATLFDRPQVSDHGLGLYLVSEITDSYDGSVTLSKTGEDGTVFEFRFPVPEPRP
ncbi:MULTISPECIES: sensor histidine kinase [Halomicrobium]|uniref:histidine kinase n=2 Tax=Halomicrobium mukohataei TaxID=57705 RepID=C7NXC2_HALMD|nr:MULTISPECIES: HAMP domain-containing sensor histidine kinase [Halomicrobium]ACV48356.1 histidine kinase [Halomicrobium mukohataei DSM 12286]QCD66766.1 HAMP domain-containing histidine kinase [Halomicrobium mukohataei]QFR21575.1 GHKL domain-containing protein [Halomicrobium sp. ZPS1]